MASNQAKNLGRPPGSRNKRNRRRSTPSSQPLFSRLTQVNDKDSDNDSVSSIDLKEFCDNAIENAISAITKELKSLESQFQRALEYESSRITTLEKDNLELKEHCKNLEKRVTVLEEGAKSQVQTSNKQERLSRRSNFRIVGLTEETGEDCLALTKQVLEELNMKDTRIERAHRDGRTQSGKSRHLLVRISFYQDKAQIMKTARSLLQEKPYHIVDDLTRTDLSEKKNGPKKSANYTPKGSK